MLAQYVFIATYWWTTLKWMCSFCHPFQQLLPLPYVFVLAFETKTKVGMKNILTIWTQVVQWPGIHIYMFRFPTLFDLMYTCNTTPLHLQLPLCNNSTCFMLYFSKLHLTDCWINDLVALTAIVKIYCAYISLLFL